MKKHTEPERRTTAIPGRGYRRHQGAGLACAGIGVKSSPGKGVRHRASRTGRNGSWPRWRRAMDDMVLQKAGFSANDLTAIGMAVPGVVDPDRGHGGRGTRTCRLTGVALGRLLESRFKAPIIIGNDGNFGRPRRNLARFGPQRHRARFISASARASAAGWCCAAGCGVAIASRPARSAT